VDGTDGRHRSVGWQRTSDPTRWSTDGLASVPPKGCGGERRMGARDMSKSSPARPILQSGGEQVMTVHRGQSLGVAAAVLTERLGR
jgi:hypothetical protein